MFHDVTNEATWISIQAQGELSEVVATNGEAVLESNWLKNEAKTSLL
jgi:hypothetical protein